VQYDFLIERKEEIEVALHKQNHGFAWMMNRARSLTGQGSPGYLENREKKFPKVSLEKDPP
jgi:hypothetical protein